MFRYANDDEDNAHSCIRRSSATIRLVVVRTTIADRRLISHEDDKITFWARARNKANKSEPFTLRGDEFVRRWSLHILPKGYTRSRSYGGYHCGKRAEYLECCRQILDTTRDEASPQTEFVERPSPTLPKCESCRVEMCCVASSRRPSWREVFTAGVYREPVYSPTLHIHFGNAQAQSIGGYG